MNLRNKLISPLALLLTLMLFVLQFYIFPQMHKHLEAEFDATEQAILEAIGPSLVSLLLTQDIAEIHKLLSEQQVRRPRWKSLIVHDENNTRIYPLSLDNKSNGYGHTFTYKIKHGEKIIGVINLLSDSHQSVHKKEAAIKTYSYLFLGMILLATIIIGWLQSILITNPISHLASATRNIARGNFDTDLSYQGNDEIAQLTSSFSSMRDNVKAQQSALEKEAEQIQAIMDNVFNSIITADINGIIMSCNLSTESIFGYSRQELIGQNLTILMNGMETLAHNQYLQNFGLNNDASSIFSSREVLGKHKDGHEIYLELAVNSVIIDDKPMFIGALQDISKRKNAEQALTIQQTLTTTINQAQNYFISIGDPVLFFSSILPDVMAITGSEYGLFGEVFARDGQPSFTQVYALNCTTWNNITTAKYNKHINDGLIIQSGDNPFTDVISSGKICISEKIYKADENQGMVQLNNFLGIPIYIESRLMGILCLANRKGGFDNSVVDLIQPIINASSQTLDAVEKNRQREQHKFELEIARDEAEAAVRAKSNFLATMSHEIRTPMNGVLGMLHLLSNSPLDDKQQRYIETASSSGELLLTVINDILDFSKIEAGKLDLEIIPFNPAVLVEETTVLLANAANEKGLELICGLDPDLPAMVKGDPTRLRQILTNLMNNAIKFTEKGHVVIFVAYHDGNLHFSVADTGIGISDEQQSHLFKSFSQVDSSHTRKYGGTGLGLVISKRLVDIMGGELEVCSETGFGSEFSFDVPLEKISDNQLDTEIIPLLKDKRVLIVDDSYTNLTILDSVLSGWQIENISTAENGMTAMARITESTKLGFAYDIVILDMQMPGMDGLELAKHIRHTDGMQATKLIMLSSVLRSENHPDLDAWLSKPLRQLDLLNTLKVLLTEEKSSHATGNNQNKATLENFKDCHLLLVEDNQVNQIVAQGILEQFGFDIDICENGLDALNKVQEVDYDLVLMDIQMPVMDGLEATRQIRQLGGKYTDLPIIAMTAHALTGDSDISLEAGMNAHLNKPIEAKRVISTIKQWLPESKTPQTTTGPDIKDTQMSNLQLPDLYGIDLADGLNRMNNNWPAYQRALIGFYNKQKDFISEIVSMLDTEQWGKAIGIAHILKGSSGNIGAENLFKTAGSLEIACKEQDSKLANKLVKTLTAEFEQVINGLEQFTETIAMQETAISNTSISSEEIATNLHKLIQLLDSDLGEAQNLLEELNQITRGSQWSDAVNDLFDALQQFDIDRVRDGITSLQEKCTREDPDVKEARS